MLDRMNKYSGQEESDAVAIISDELDTLVTLLNRFFEKASPYAKARFEKLWPGHEQLDRCHAKALAMLSCELAPPSD